MDLSICAFPSDQDGWQSLSAKCLSKLVSINGSGCAVGPNILGQNVYFSI